MENNTRGLGVKRAGPPQYNRGKNYFFGIGIDAYAKPFNKLRNCVNDVTKVSRTLLDGYDFEEENIILLINEQASRKGIIKKLREVLDKVGENDSLIFMYSGHGDNLDKTNVGFMIPADAADEEDFINLSDIKSRLDAADAKHIFVIFDACFSGLLLTQRDARAQNLPENFPSRYAMTSGRNHPVDDGEGEHSPFAKALIDELSENDDSLGSVMLAQRILDRFRRTGKDDDQLPAFGRISSDIEYEGQYYFYPKNYELSAARERTKRLEAEQARRIAEEALVAAERERKRAEKLARAATNAAAFMQWRDIDPTFSMRMMQYNLTRHPDSQISHSMYQKLVTSDTTFMQKILRGPQTYVNSLSFSPDGAFLAVGDNENAVNIWSVATGQLLKKLEGHEGVVMALTFTKDGKYLIAGEDSKILRLWSVVDWTVVKTFKSKQSSCRTLAVSSDNQFFAAGFNGNKIEIWSLESGKCTQILRGHDTMVSNVFFYNNDQNLISSSEDSSVKIWSVTSGECLKTYFDEQKPITDLAVSPDGQWMACCCASEFVELRSVATGEVFRTWGSALKPVYKPAFVRAFDSMTEHDSENLPTHFYILLQTDTSVVKMYALDTSEVVKKFSNQNGIITNWAFSSDGQQMAWGQQDGSVSLWSLKKDFCQKVFNTEHGFVNGIAVTQGSRSVVAAYEDASIIEWSLETGELLRSLGEPETTFSCLILSADNRYLVLGSVNGWFEVHDFRQNKLLRKVNTESFATAAATFLPDNDSFLMACTNGDVTLWSAKTGQALKTYKAHDVNINAVKIVSEGSQFLTASDDNTAKLWSVETGDCLRTFDGLGNSAGDVTLSPDKKLLAMACADYMIRLYDFESAKLLTTWAGHQNGVSCVIFSADGKQLFSASGDKTIKIWSVETGTPLKTFVGHQESIKRLEMCPDGVHFVTASEDFTVRYWHLSDAVEDRTATYALYDLMDWQLHIEAEDTPQYIEEFKQAIETGLLTAEDAASRIDFHFKDPSVTKGIKERIGIKVGT